jgi:hypothetical protein
MVAHSAMNALQKSKNQVMPFVAQSAMATGALPGEGYEAFIHRTGQIPLRDNWHDLFNGLVWLKFPRAKAHFNRLHVQEIARHGAPSPRGPVRDALTVFDENGAVLRCPDALWQALVAKDWQRLFVTERHLWQQAQLVIFGHALLEKLLVPRKAMVAHVYRINWGSDHTEYPHKASKFIAISDQYLDKNFTPELLATKPFAPLPVLGVPGWWSANEEPGFYEDAAVFRRP